MKKLFFTLFCLLSFVFCQKTNAQHDFTAAYSNGIGNNKTIYYRITSTEAPLTVAVTYRSGSVATNNYTTYIVIPATVTNGTGVNLKTYQVTSVDASAFSGQTTLDSVLLPNSVTFIDSLAFFNCTRLAKCVLPSDINFIGKKAFYGCSALKGITLPNNITKISNGTFDNCRALTSVNIPSSVTSIGEQAFANCILLESVNMSSPDILNPPNMANSIGNQAFSNCISLESVNLSSAVAKVSPTTFLGCLNLNSINVDADNQVLMSDGGVLYSYLQDTLFFYPVKKQGVNFTPPNSVKHINDYSFAYNLYLKNINFNNSLKKIGSSAFYNCTGLFTANIADSVSYIGENAFYNCRSLSSIKIKAATPPDIQESTFYNVPNNTPVYVFCGVRDSYTSDFYWGHFTNIRGMADETLLTGATIYDTICSNKIYYFGGIRITESGTYTNIIQTNYGCDSVVTLNIVVFEKSPETIINATIPKDSIYNENGFFEGITGTYKRTETDINGCDSVIILNLTVESSSGLNDIDFGKITIFPNPTKDELKIMNYELRIMNVEITDLAGRIVETQNFASLQGNITINVSSLPQGIYLVKIYTDKGIKVERLIKN